MALVLMCAWHGARSLLWGTPESTRNFGLTRATLALGARMQAKRRPQARLICCLLAVEISDYEAKPIFDQARLTQDFHSLLDATVCATSHDLVSIVEEDGALLGFPLRSRALPSHRACNSCSNADARPLLRAAIAYRYRPRKRPHWPG